MVPIGAFVQSVTSWNPERSSEADFTYVDLGAVDQNAKVIAGARAVSIADAPSRARQLLRSGDVIVSTVRPNLNAVAMVPPDLDGATASTGFCVLRPCKDLDSRYLFHWVRSARFVEKMTRLATGASYPAVTDRIVLESLLPLPSLAEQRRIADLLDKADALCDKRRATVARADELPGSLFVEMFGDPVPNPRKWLTVGFGEVVERIESGWSPVCLDRPVSGAEEWGVLRLGAVTWGRFDSGENKALPSDLDPDPTFEVHQGDLLLVRKNTYDLVGASAYVWETRPRLMLPDLIFRLSIRSAVIDPVFLHHLLSVPTKRRTLQQLAGGSAGSMPNISKAKLSSIRVELPPLDLQKRFRRAVEASERLRRDVLESATALDSVFLSLQYRAFRGELTA